MNTALVLARAALRHELLAMIVANKRTLRPHPVSSSDLLVSFRTVGRLQLAVNRVGEAVCFLEGLSERVGLVVVKRGLHLVAHESQPLNGRREGSRDGGGKKQCTKRWLCRVEKVAAAVN